MSQPISHLCIFEDEHFTKFLPLAYNRPVYNFRVGAFTLEERIRNQFSNATVHHISRAYLKPTLREQGCNVLSLRAIPWEDHDRVAFVNGGLLDAYALQSVAQPIDEDSIHINNGRIVCANLNGKHAKEFAYYLHEHDSAQLLAKLSQKIERKDSDLRIAEYIWDLIAQNPGMIAQDYEHAFADLPSDNSGVDPGAVLYNPEKIYVAPGARVDAFAVIDARDGAVILMPDTIIEPFSHVQGPTVIGAGTRIVGGQIREGTSIGPVCRIGGEVEETIIQGYANKYHAGFLGHSYIGEWVNIGAMATNSDLKNTYSSIRAVVNDRVVNTRLQKLGMFVADHAKIGIGTLINAGTFIGLGSNVLNGSVPKYVPSFTWGANAEFSEYRIDKLVETIKLSMARRDKIFSLADENLLRLVFHLTLKERYTL